MKILLLVFTLYLGNIHLWAQTSKIYVVKSWEIPIQIIPVPDQNRYPEFREGMIYYSNKAPVFCKLNYSVLYGEMQFIAPEGDTLAIGNEHTVKKVIIGQDVFYYLYGQGFVEVIADYPALRLAHKQHTKVILGDYLSRGSDGYSVQEGIGYNKDPMNYPTLKQIYSQQTHGLMKIARETSYYFIDHNNRFYPAQKKILFELFPRKRRKIQAYIKEKQIDFKQGDALLKMVKFCSQTES
jgi:hypothetical protein